MISHISIQTVKRSGGSATASSEADVRHLANSTLGASNLKAAVKLPTGEHPEEWISFNVFEFLGQIKLVYGVVSVLHCNRESCVSMRAGGKYEFLWCDGANPKFKRPTRLAACDYICLALDQCQSLLDDESIFPTEPDQSRFQSATKTIVKRIFRVYAHLYHHHFQVFVDSAVDPLLNTSFKHFIYFVREFGMIAEKDLEPLAAVIAQIN